MAMARLTVRRVSSIRVLFLEATGGTTRWRAKICMQKCSLDESVGEQQQVDLASPRVTIPECI